MPWRLWDWQKTLWMSVYLVGMPWVWRVADFRIPASIAAVVWLVIMAGCLAQLTPAVEKFSALNLNTAAWTKLRVAQQLLLAVVAVGSVWIATGTWLGVLSALVCLVVIVSFRKKPQLDGYKQGKGRGFIPVLPATPEAQLVVRPLLFVWGFLLGGVTLGAVLLWWWLDEQAADNVRSGLIGAWVGVMFISTMLNTESLRNYVTLGGTRRRWSQIIGAVNGVILVVLAVAGSIVAVLRAQTGDDATILVTMWIFLIALVAALIQVSWTFALLARNTVWMLIATLAGTGALFGVAMWSAQDFSWMRAAGLVSATAVYYLITWVFIAAMVRRVRLEGGGLSEWLGMKQKASV